MASNLKYKYSLLESAEVKDLFLRVRGKQCVTRVITTFIAIECLFLVSQVVILFPCLVGSPPQNTADLRETEVNVASPTARALKQEELDVNSDGTLRYKPNWESLETRPTPQWFEDAKIGLFINWGVFSVPSFSGSETNGYAEWFWYYMKTGLPPNRNHSMEAIASVKSYMKYMYPPNFKYTDFAQKFTAEFFDPDKWANLFQDSGAKYLVLNSKHHEGFAMWGSKHSWNWNSVDCGPHRDIVGDLGHSIRTQTNLRYGLYHSLYEWYHPLYLNDKHNNFTTNRYVEEKLGPELRHLVETYRPDMVWADGDWEATCQYWNCTNFIAWLYNDSPVKDTVVTNDRWGHDVTCKHGGYLTCFDAFNPGSHNQVLDRKWENFMALDRESWGYRRNAKLSDYYNMEELLKVLAQTISHGGNLLINIGVTGDGRIPPLLEERLKGLGSWLKVNGDAVYGTRPWKYMQDPLNNNLYYTMKKNGLETDVYGILLVWPDDDMLELSAPQPSANTHITWLGYHGNIEWEGMDTTSIFNRDGGRIRLRLPQVSVSEIAGRWAWVFRFTALENAIEEEAMTSSSPL